MTAWRSAGSPAALATALSALAVTIAPELLVPPARLYRALCERHPVLATVTFHAPPLPLALLILLAGVALAIGTVAGVTECVRTHRFNRGLRQAAQPAPSRLVGTARALGLPSERITYLDRPEPTALCYGFLRPRVAMTSGLFTRLDDEALTAVLAHEIHHLRRRDPLRYLVLHALSSATVMVPLTWALRRRREAQIELAADRAALSRVPAGALAAALLAAVDGTRRPVAGTAGLTTTEARIAHLTGRAMLPPIPPLSVLASAGLAAILTLAVVSLTRAAGLVQMACELCPGGS